MKQRKNENRTGNNDTNMVINGHNEGGLGKQQNIGSRDQKQNSIWFVYIDAVHIL